MTVKTPRRSRAITATQIFLLATLAATGAATANADSPPTSGNTCFVDGVAWNLTPSTAVAGESADWQLSLASASSATSTILGTCTIDGTTWLVTPATTIVGGTGPSSGPSWIATPQQQASGSASPGKRVSGASF
jgi:hypothetical protein